MAKCKILTFDEVLEPFNGCLMITFVLLHLNYFCPSQSLHLLLDFRLVDEFVKLQILFFELCDEVEVFLFDLDDYFVLALVLDDPVLFASLEIELSRMDPCEVYLRHSHLDNRRFLQATPQARRTFPRHD